MVMFYLLSYVFRGIVISMEDGTLKFLSLARIANDVPATGRLFVGTKTQGVSTYQLSEYLIWSVHASDTTGTFSNHLSQQFPYP
jgi:general transcription factor 3C polypeptide 2